MKSRIRVQLPAVHTPQIRKMGQIFARQVAERCGAETVLVEQGPAEVKLSIEPGIGAEGFCIEAAAEGVRVVGNDERGLYYGLGKLLRTARYGEGSFAPGAWRGRSVPTRRFRMLYFATHFHNFYHDAPLDEVARYIEDIMLWGYNGLVVWYDMHHFAGIDDPAAQKMLARLRALLQTARDLGMETGLTLLANEGYSSTPEAMRAEWHAQNGYTGALAAHYHVEICPHKPGGMERILDNIGEEFAQFRDVGIDLLSLWPYDQGGCTCERCAPWGAKGYLTAGEQVAALFRDRFPQGKVSLSTWWFDYVYPDEWQAFARAVSGRFDWADYLLIDAHCDRPFPSYTLEHGVPEDKPVINFPEISMYGMAPWGGYGANPFPARLQQLWDSAKQLIRGGFPYSEGIYEDLNKAVYAQFYWNDRPAAETVREYLAGHFGESVADELLPVVEIMEKTLVHRLRVEGESRRVEMPETAGAAQALARVQAAEGRMTHAARANWRWRLLALRALIDAELAAHDQRITEACETAFEELAAIYHARQALACVAPPARSLGR